MEVSGLELVTWLVFRAEQISSPNMLESDLKAVTCFRQVANRPFVDYHFAEETLLNLLRDLEASPSNLMDPEPDIIQVLIRETIQEYSPENFVGLRQVAIYTLMCWGPAKFEEIQELELR